MCRNQFATNGLNVFHLCKMCVFSIGTQVDQKWPLLYHLSALVLPSGVESKHLLTLKTRVSGVQLQSFEVIRQMTPPQVRGRPFEVIRQIRYRSAEECDTCFTLFPGLFTLHVRGV